MRLMDLASAADESFDVVKPDGECFTLPGAGALKRKLHQAPLRYVLDDAVSNFAAGMAHEDGRLLDCADLARLPAPTLWLEWNDTGRGRSADGKRGKIGLLVTSGEHGQGGRFETIWTDENGGAELSPLIAEFSFHEQGPARRSIAADEVVWSATLPEAWPVRDLLQRVRFSLRPEWVKFYRDAGLSAAQEGRILRHYTETAAADFLFMLAFALTLVARNAVDERPSELSRLNQSRGKRGKPALLDYVEVSARLEPEGGAGLGMAHYAREEARLHFVCGHRVRGGGEIFWRRARLRGNVARGAIRGRNVSVHLEGAARGLAC